jgi:hypothetical protein
MAESRLVVRPSMFGSKARARWRHGLWFLPLATVNLLRMSLQGALWVIGGVGSCGLLSLGLTSLQRLTLTDDTVLRRSWLGRTRSCPISGIARVVETRIYLTRLGEPETWLLFVAPDGRCLLRACVSLCERNDLAALQAAIGKPWDETFGFTTVAEVRRRYPGSFRLPWAHYWLTTIILLAVTGVVAVIVVAIVMAVR